MKNKKKIIIFDLDGTLLKFSADTFSKSLLGQKVLFNSELFIKNYLRVGSAKAKQVIKKIKNKYGEEVSIGLEKEYGISRLNFFNQVWNIKDKNFIKEDLVTREVLIKLQKNYLLYILSDAPRIWINIVLKKLSIEAFFENRIFSGEGEYRKSLGNAFENFIDKTGFDSARCISVGDQENTDIIPAELLGMKTVLIGQVNKNTGDSITINELKELTKYLKN